MTHFLYVPFTGLGLKNGFRGEQWLANRIKVFRQFVIPSIMHQSKRDFILWVSWRPEEEGNPQVMELESALRGLRDFPVIFTYEGLCFEDDKYDRPESLNRLANNLKNTLPTLAPLITGDEVLMTIQPSDDMYLSNMVRDVQEEAKKFTVKPMSIGYRRGYMLNMNTLELAEYANQKEGWQTDKESTYTTYTIPPFFTVVFPRSIFLDYEAHMKWTGPYRSHEYIGDHTDYHDIKGPGFIVGTHGENVSTTWTHRYKGRMIEGLEKESVFLQVGMVKPEPITLEQDKGRILENKIVNKLPNPLKRLWVRHTSPGIGKAIDSYHYFRL